MIFNKMHEYRTHIGFTIVLLIIVAIEYLSISRVSMAVNDFSIVVNNLIPAIEITDNILECYNRVSRAMRNLLITNNHNEIQRSREYIQKNRVELQNEFDKLEKSKGIMNRLIFLKMKEDYYKISQLEDKIIALGLDKKIAEADKLLTTELRVIQNKFLKEIQLFIDYQIAAANDLNKKVTEQNDYNYLFMLLLSIVTIILIMIIVFHITSNQKIIKSEREELASKLNEALVKVKVFGKLLTACDSCKKIKDDKGNWRNIETYFPENTDLECNHCLCPECAKILYSQKDYPRPA